MHCTDFPPLQQRLAASRTFGNDFRVYGKPNNLMDLTINMSIERVEALIDRFCEPAIMVHRIYPPVGGPVKTSALGGVPSLPEEMEWPRTSKGVPLHFLAQIDCSEINAGFRELPDHGVLFFFALTDINMDWHDKPPHEFCRVLFTSDLGNNPRVPPSDLGTIMGGIRD
jgi:Domain of unknown function (DUF1963)